MNNLAIKQRIVNKSILSYLRIIVLILILPHSSLAFQTLIPGLGKRIINVITIDNLSPNIIYVGTGTDFSSGETGCLFKSTNGGATWDTLLRNVTVRDIDIHPTNPNILYASLGINFLTLAGVVKSLDGGTTWAKADSGVYSDFEVGPSQLAIDPFHPETLYVGTAGIFGGKFYKTVNGGKFWFSLGDTTYLKYGPTAIAVNPESTQVVYAGTNKAGYIMKSPDGGMTWIFTGLEQGVTESIEFSNPASTIYFGSWGGGEYNRGIFKSIDAGRTWTNIDQGIVDSVFDVLSIQFDGSGVSRRVFITGNTHTYKPRIYYRYENESKWKVMSVDTTVSQFKTMTIHNGKIWIGSWGGLFAMEVPTKVLQENPLTIPDEIKLYPNYPNPFNGTTKIVFELSKYCHLNLQIVDITGKLVNNLYNGTLDAGKYDITWGGRNTKGETVSSGVYFVILRAENNQRAQKIVFAK